MRMNIFYGDSKGRADVSGNSPSQVTLETAVEVFRGLDPRSGFLGINLDERFVVQFATKRGGVHVELLDTSGPSYDACMADSAFAESLIRAAAQGQDVFQVARASNHEWEHTDLA
jgi:hypothetical protein